MSGDLAGYCEQVAARRFAFGDLDCCTLMADWLVRCGLPDPMADRRGAYATREQYMALLIGEGGIIRSCQRRFAAIGLWRTREPRCGDVCLVRAPVDVGEGRIEWCATGALVASKRLRAVVTPDQGLVFSGAEVLQAWRVSQCLKR